MFFRHKKYESIQKGFVVDIIQIIIERTSVSPEFTRSLFLFFDGYSGVLRMKNTLAISIEDNSLDTTNQGSISR
jgi:hypothetical protein